MYSERTPNYPGLHCSGERYPRSTTILRFLPLDNYSKNHTSFMRLLQVKQSKKAGIKCRLLILLFVLTLSVGAF